MSVYRVHFKWKNKDVSIRARSLDMTHPYFVSIKGLLFSEGERLIIDPGEEELKHAFGDAEQIMIPFQSVALIEELSEKELQRKQDTQGDKIKPFIRPGDTPPN